MRHRALLIALAVLLPAAFVTGRLSSCGRTPAGPEARRVLYYVDPMNPAFHSPEPGTAPCGMPLEPVYADGAAPGAGGGAPPGAVTVRADRLHLVGVARETVRPRAVSHTLRLLGTVAADETRLYRISAATAGRVREMGAATTGSLVAKGEILGAYFSADVLAPQQNFLQLHKTYDAVQKTGGNPRETFKGGGQLAAYWRNIDVARQALMNFGMSPQQIEEIARSNQPTYLVQLRAPASGLVTSRNVVLGQSFDAGEELFAIADLSRVWVLADAFEGQEESFRPGATATVTAAGTGRRFSAVVSPVLPRFEPETRTLRVRLEAPNPDYVLRPGMFVDVELPVEARGMFVPKEAVLDSGTRKAVFVEEAAGVFVPRAVQTGRRLGDLVEIRGGLMEGDTVVTAGNFLLDSESRMRTSAASAAGTALDPVCGMEVDEAKAVTKGLVSRRDGTAWYFCSPTCREAFDRTPADFLPRPEHPPATPHAGETHPGDHAAPGAMPMPAPGPMPDASPAPVPHAMPAPMPAPMPGSMPGSPTEVPPDTMPAPMPGDATGSMPMPAPGRMPDAAPHAMPDAPPGGMPDAMPMPAAQHGAHGAAGAGAGRAPGKTAVDPACGMEVDEAQASAAGLVSDHGGRTWFFCSPECKRDFDADPEPYLPPGR